MSTSKFCQWWIIFDILPCSYFLYSIARPDKYGEPLIDLDLSSDLSEAEVQAAQLRGTSEKQKKLDQVLTKIFQNYSVSPGAAASQTLRNRLSVKLWRMGKMLSKVGGPKRIKILCNWKTSDWSLIIDSPKRKRCCSREIERDGASCS